MTGRVLEGQQKNLFLEEIGASLSRVEASLPREEEVKVVVQEIFSETFHGGIPPMTLPPSIYSASFPPPSKKQQCADLVKIQELLPTLLQSLPLFYTQSGERLHAVHEVLSREVKTFLVRSGKGLESIIDEHYKKPLRGRSKPCFEGIAAAMTKLRDVFLSLYPPLGEQEEEGPCRYKGGEESSEFLSPSAKETSFREEESAFHSMKHFYTLYENYRALTQIFSLAESSIEEELEGWVQVLLAMLADASTSSLFEDREEKREVLQEMERGISKWEGENKAVLKEMFRKWGKDVVELIEKEEKGARSTVRKEANSFLRLLWRQIQCAETHRKSIQGILEEIKPRIIHLKTDGSNDKKRILVPLWNEEVELSSWIHKDAIREQFEWLQYFFLHLEEKHIRPRIQDWRKIYTEIKGMVNRAVPKASPPKLESLGTS